jgi:carbamoyl-phosphate synthase large subunit
MKKGPLRVLVTSVGGRAVGHQIVHALQRLEGRYTIVAADADAFSFGLYQVPDRHLVPHGSAPDYAAEITGLVKRQGIDVLLPGSETELRTLVGIRQALSDAGCHLVASPAEAVSLCQNKDRLYQWLENNDFGVPSSAGHSDWRDLVSRFGFPIVAKPSGASGGSRNVALLADFEEVARYIASFPGTPEQIVFQEYVGDADNEYTVGVIIAQEGVVIDSIVLRRVLKGLSLGTTRVICGKTYTLSTGYSQGVIVKDAAVQELCENLALSLGLVGPVNVQLRKHGSGIKVFEVHPRFSGTTSIRADAGFNEPDLVIRNQLLGEKLGRQSYLTEVAAIRAFQSILVPVEMMQDLDAGFR